MILAVSMGAHASSLSTGPFEGTVKEGEKNTHHYQNSEPGTSCPQVMVYYTVTLEYEPASDTLGLAAGGESAIGSNGFAQVGFWDSYCTAFDIEVAGLSVNDVASYTVTVEQSDGGVTYS